ncbi:hypothetical protein DH2020_049566 [Rehmannia glutinosa]|uniref:TMEM205-like domain-containing protein n=1 Tax=Rehmannia glutinosa TaxID=99300 RepID=A0ABR0U2X0_REHGL
MMNVLALGLVLTSLLTAGFFTPTPEKQSSKEDVIVKEGHRVVVVEFEKDDGHTKVLISPQDSQPSQEKGVAENAKDEKMEALKEKTISEEEIQRRVSPRELVCDAYGKCKHKIASALGKTKETVYEVEEEAKEAIGKAKDTVTQTAHQAFDKMRETKESVEDSATEASTKAKDKVTEKASEIKEGAKQQVQDVIDTTKKVKDEIEKDASRKMEGTKEMVENAKQGAQRVKKEGQKELSEILHHAREVAVDVFDYVVSPVRLASLTGVLHLMGFAAAYGMCVWVTFASSYVLSGALPRNQFAIVQSKIYPVYFKAMAYSVGMALLGHLMSQRNRLSVGMFQGFNLMASVVMILVNLLYLEPRATKVMLERMKKEKEEGRGKEGQATEPSARVVDSTAETAGRVATTAGEGKQEEVAAKAQIARLSETLQRLNSYSSFLNVLTLMSLTWHLVHLGQRMHNAC